MLFFPHSVSVHFSSPTWRSLPMRDYRSVNTFCPLMCLQSCCWTGFHPFSPMLCLRPPRQGYVRLSLHAGTCHTNLFKCYYGNPVCLTKLIAPSFFMSCPREWKQYYGSVIFTLVLSENTIHQRGPTWHNDSTSVDFGNVVPHLVWGQRTWGALEKVEIEVIRSRSLGGPSHHIVIWHLKIRYLSCHRSAVSSPHQLAEI